MSAAVTERVYICEPVRHCGARRGRLLAGGFADRQAAQAALEALGDEHPNAYLLPISVIATDDERAPPSMRSLTFDEARELHAKSSDSHPCAVPKAAEAIP